MTLILSLRQVANDAESKIVDSGGLVRLDHDYCGVNSGLQSNGEYERRSS